MQRLIFIVLLVISSSVMGMQNTVTVVDECIEFQEKSTYYYDKAELKDKKIYSTRFKLLGKYFKMMYKSCLKDIEKNKSYPGYRDNILQQKQ